MGEDQGVTGRKLIAAEKEDAFWVVWEDDPEDWVVIFSKREGFPARQWAERMVDLYNTGSAIEVPPSVIDGL